MGRARKRLGPLNQGRGKKITLAEKIPYESKMKPTAMKLTENIKEQGALGYIFLWLLGIPIPILLVIFLLRGCT